MTTPYQERPRKGGGNEALLPETGRPRLDWNGHTNSQWRRLLPIAFTAENAQKVHAGTKTQTRRLAHSQQDGTTRPGDILQITGPFSRTYRPRYRVGDVLWIQEPWRTNSGLDNVKPTLLTDAAPIGYEGEKTQGYWNGKLRPGRFLPLRFARQRRYEVTAVRLERVNEISFEDAVEEGCLTCEVKVGRLCKTIGAQDVFGELWNSIHTAPGTRFEDAPWVFVYPFRRVR